MDKKKDIFYSLPEVWDLCLEKIYNKEIYISGFLDLMKSIGITQESLILDAGCGSGFPAIDLIESGYHVIGVDKSSEMVRQIKINARKRGVSIEAKHIMWSELSKNFNPIFDFIYCRGNSLIYAASWEQNWIVPNRSREEILEAIKNFYQILKPGGKLYIDITSKNEKPDQRNIGIVQTRRGPVQIFWKVEHDRKNKIRAWKITLKFLTSGKDANYLSYSYLLPHKELIKFLKDAGFKKTDKYIMVKGENNYSSFVAYK